MNRCARSRLLSVPVLCLWCVVLPGCLPEAVSVQDDLTAYMDQARLWAATEAKINNAIASARKDQFVHDDFVLETMRPAVGVAREYVVELERYEPKSPALAQVHQGYIESWRAMSLLWCRSLMPLNARIMFSFHGRMMSCWRHSARFRTFLPLLRGCCVRLAWAPDTPTGRPLTPPREGFSIDPSA